MGVGDSCGVGGPLKDEEFSSSSSHLSSSLYSLSELNSLVLVISKRVSSGGSAFPLVLSFPATSTASISTLHSF